MTMMKFWAGLASLVPLMSLSGVAPVPADRSSVTDFERLCGYLGAESGVWVAPNPDREATRANVADSFDLTFVCDDAQRGLRMEIGARYSDGTRRVPWRAMWFWHPGRREIVYLNYGRGGHVVEGVTEFTADDVFVTTYDRYQPDGTRSRGRDENTILSADEHRTQVYTFEDGEWRPGNSNLWRLESEKTK
ncbi:MAG: hypothetical protein GWM92_20130 [Gemmatimonadetes bacterium]|nr:hypothetical protein [Gemmatimonadota bacterium]NIR81133.1 hypothetical protein [Gemmatimonadota bacterium]NIT89957.1 hypothetical protein [Gemmatimonadota bacterium]NIU33763.1 hypothetical protein [Gemmatimonadota bacterium]NIU37997.1 hypothetical protein [Gemmatimonadota bacterium]